MRYRTPVVLSLAFVSAAFIIAPLLVPGIAFGQAASPDDAASGLQPGVTFRVFQVDGDIKKIPQLAENQTPNFDQIRPTIDFKADAFPKIPSPLVAHIKAMLRIDAGGDYVFRLTSDDGSRMMLNGNRVVDHDGRHGVTAMEGTAVHLDPGDHPLFIEYFDAGGGKRLLLEWQPFNADGFSVVPEKNLFTEIDNARVTAPGVKALRDERRAGDGKPVAGVHPGYTLTHIAPSRDEAGADTGFVPMIGAMTMMADGRLIVGTFSPLQRTDTDLVDIDSKKPDKLWAITGVMGDPAKMTVKAVADGLYEPLGLCAVGDVLYVSHRKAITRLIDKDHDGFFETHEDVGSGWEAWNYHQFAFGLLHRDNKLYATLSTAMAPPAWKGMNDNSAPNGPMRGSVIEVDLSSNNVSVVASGIRSPNGIGFGPGGSMFYCDNQGTWMPSNQMGEVVPGHFFGHYNNTNIVPQLESRFPTGGVASIWADRLRSPAAIDLVHNDFANSPTQPVLIESGPYAGQMLIGELTAGGVRRAFLEKINGQWQGAAFQFSQGFSVGINRVAWGPDGTLVVGGIGALGNWNWKGTKSGLDRLTPSGTTCFEMFAIRARNDGFEVEFTKPVAANWLADASHYTMKQWRYKPTVAYGGPKVDEEALVVREATPSADGLRVVLKVDGLKAGRTVSLRADPVSEAGEKIWSTTAYYTLNYIPAEAELAAARSQAKLLDQPLKVDGLGVGVQPPADAAVLIGRSAQAAFTTPADAKKRPSEKRTQDDLLKQPEYAEVGNGDLTSRASFGDCRMHIEWYCPPGGEGQKAGNSGVYLQNLYEVQVLGTLPGSRKLQPNEAASIYNVKPPDSNASTGPGTWQAYDLFFVAPRFEGGKKVASARLTAFWNGVLVHNDVTIDGPTGGAAKAGESGVVADAANRALGLTKGPGMQIGPVRLQDHETDAAGPVRYRNMWVAPLGAPTSAPGPWVKLSDAATLDGDWAVRGGNATFAVEPATAASPALIVGSSIAKSPNSFLVSKKAYGDFELILDAKQDKDLNSGIQIRSHVDGGLDNRSGKLIGYQVELDPSDRAYSAGIYDEARRGWLYPLVDNPAARSAFKPGEWNTIRVVATGPVIRTWINGVPAADIYDATDAAGHIALQVHDVGDRTDALRVQFRNVRIRELK